MRTAGFADAASLGVHWAQGGPAWVAGLWQRSFDLLVDALSRLSANSNRWGEVSSTNKDSESLPRMIGAALLP
jgi:hypothetical protein